MKKKVKMLGNKTGKRLFQFLKLGALILCGLTFFNEDLVAQTGASEGGLLDSDLSYFMGNRYYNNNFRIPKKEFESQLAGFPESYAVYRTGKKTQGINTIFALVGGALIGWPIGGAIAGEEKPQWWMIGAGLGVISIGIPFYIRGSKKIKKGIELYNSRL